MEQRRKVCNLIIAILLTTVSIHPVSSSQNLYTFTTIDIDSTDSDRTTDYTSLQPSNFTTSVYQDSTTYLPISTSIQTEEIFDSAETNTLNRYPGLSRRREEFSEKDDDLEESPDHAIPSSEHEEAKDVSTRPKYVAPGVWAKPSPEKNISLDFMPTKLHAQVRGIHTVKRLPQREAIKSAKTDEEKRNAPRLRRVVINSKVNTVYTEEGYEDSAYDHAGHIRDADFHEGFARKLHDRKNNKHNFASNKKKKKKHENLVPDEFKKYEEDYQDHFKENRRASDDENSLTGYGRNIWEGSEIDSKLVAENGIRKLEEDIEEDAEETERSSKNYQNTQESKLRNDVKVVNAESEDSHDENDLKDEETESDKIKEKKSKLWNGKDNTVIKETKQSPKLEQKKKKKLYRENHETTAISSDETNSTDTKILANSYDFLTNPSNSLRYVAPTATASFHQADNQPTTISYSQLFWNYFKTRQGPSTTESSVLVPDSTTMNPRQEERTPIAVATVDGHGPYLLVTKSDDVDYVNNVVSTVATFTSVQPLLLQSLPSLNPEDAEYSSPTNLLDNIMSSSTPAVMTLNITQEAYSRIADYHENPFLGSILDNSKIAITKSKVKYKVAMRPKSEKKPVKLVTHRSPYQQVSSSSTSKKDDENKKIREELNSKYNKMLNYIKSKQKTQSPPEKKIVFPEDLTLMRPPILQQATYSIFPINRSPVIQDHHSSVSVENETPREAKWRSSWQDQFYSQPIELPLRSDIQPFPYIQPVRLIYHKNSLPATKLLPPPLSLPSTYANYHNDRQSDNYPSYIGGKPQQKRDNEFKYFPLVPEASWRTRSRRKRSEFRNGTAVDVKVAANNGVTNDDESEQRDEDTFDRIIDRSKGKSSNPRVIDTPIIDVPDTTRLASPAKSRHGKNGTSTTLMDKKIITVNGENENSKDAKIVYNLKSDEKNPESSRSAKKDEYESDTNVQKLTTKKRNFLRDETQLRRNLKSTRNHEELLNESPKINSDVIDKEIAARFNDNNETSAKIEEQGKIETEVPSFDYIEELAEDSLAEPSTTTEAVIDSKKYPFYINRDVPSTSALKYIVDPSTIPRKTSRGMEFYDSRNAYKKCDEVEPNVDEALPEKEEPDPDRGPPENLPRLRGLGDKLDCFKAKYFDENPLDNPLFAEKLIQEPTPPSELNPAKFASRIMVLPKESDEYVVPRVSKKPERSGRQWRNRNRPYETHESIHVSYKHDRQNGRGRNAYLHTVRGSRPNNAVRRVKNQKKESRPKVSSTTTQLPKMYQTASYQNQVYEDVMGNIRNLASAYQVYEITTLPSTMQILATAGSEKTLKIANVTSNSSSKENDTSLPDVTDVNDDITDVASNTKSSEIKGLVPPPKYSAPRKTSYRKYRPPGKRRVSLLRSSNLPRIIAHHHTIKINKRSATDDTAKNSSESTINKDEKIKESVKIDVGNDTVVKSIEEEMQRTNSTPKTMDLNIEESRQINMQGQSLSTTLKFDKKKRRRNSTNSDETSEPSHKVIYTIRDRVRYSKPRWNMRGFGKFSTSSKTVDEDSRRKEPRYNYFEEKKKLDDDWRNNSTLINSTESTVGIENTTSSTEDGESSITEVYRAEESVMRQTIYGRKDEYPEREESVDVESAENAEDETENTTNMYQMNEDFDEEYGSTTTTRSTSSSNSKKVLALREYLESDPPGYAETFPEETTTLSSKYRADTNHELEDDEEKQEEETDYPKNVANPWNDDFSEKTEEQVETPMKTKLSVQDDDSEELSSKEEEASDKDRTFFTYTKGPSSAEKEKDDEHFEKETFYRPFPFSRYKSKIKKESEEDDSEEESEEKNEDYVFPWHADEENKDDKHRWLQNFDRYEYPWERRERLAKERRRKRKRADRFRKLILDDEDEEESTRLEKLVYPWERYDVPSKTRVNTRRRDISRRYTNDNEESTTKKFPFTKFSSRYSSSDRVKPSKSLNAGEISRSIEKFLEKDVDDEFKEKTSKKIEDRSPSFARKSSASPDREISRGTLVPEDITQPPRRQNRRRKISRVDKNVSNDSRFDSKKLKNEGIINEEEEEAPVVEYRKLKKSNIDDSESRIKTASQLPNSTKEASSATEQRKKHRQRISKNNSTISFNNAPVEPIIEPAKKRRRKSQLKHQTSVSPSPAVDLDTSKSVFTSVRRRYSKADEATKTNTSDSSEKSTTIKTDNLEAETSTPKMRTIEHRSRVSKEKIVTKTTYPNEAKNFYPANVTFAREEPGEKLKNKSRRRKNINKGKDNNRNSSDNKKLIERKAEKRDHGIKLVNADEIERSTVSEKPRDKNKDPFKSFEIRKAEVKNINDFNTESGISNDENDSDNGSQMSEVSLSSQDSLNEFQTDNTFYVLHFKEL